MSKQNQKDKLETVVKDTYRKIIDAQQDNEFWDAKQVTIKINIKNDELWLNKYKLIDVLGIGSYGTVLGVEVKENNEKKLKIIKIIIDQIYLKEDKNIQKSFYYINNTGYMMEIKAIEDIHKNILKKGLSPNFSYYYQNISIPLNRIVADKSTAAFPLYWQQYPSIKKMIFTIEMMLNKIKNRKQQLIPQMHIIEAEWSDISNLYSAFIPRENVKITPQKYVRPFVFGILSAVIGMHSISLQHRDIKSSNITLIKRKTRETNNGLTQPYFIMYGTHGYKIPADEQEYIPIFIDYSLTKKVETTKEQIIYQRMVTISSRAPELFVQKTLMRYTNETDIFSCGMAIVDMIKKRRSYIYFKDFTDKVYGNYNRALQDFVNLCSVDNKTLSTDFKTKFLCAENERNSETQEFITPVFKYAWNLCHMLGFPSEYKEEKLFAIIQMHANFDKRNFLWVDIDIVNLLGTDGIELLQNMLQWDFRKRSSAIDLLTNSRYFDIYRLSVQESLNHMVANNKKETHFGYIQLGMGKNITASGSEIDPYKK